MKDQKRKGEKAFEQYYSDCFGDRWAQLKCSIIKEDLKFPRPHGFNFQELQNVKAIFDQAESLKKDFQTYYMDYASFLAAMSLPLEESSEVLDMCAAPGGKSLILLQRLLEYGGGGLELNEYSTNRKYRLISVLNEFGIEAEELLKKGVELRVKNYDGLNYGIKRPESFDAILLDAPCSSEGHVLKSPNHLEKWTLKRPQGLAKKQYGLLCSAILSLRSGGYVLYSTCALTPLENDEVIARALKKKSDMVELVDLREDVVSLGEITKYGIHFLPDKGTFGPLFMCLLRKK